MYVCALYLLLGEATHVHTHIHGICLSKATNVNKYRLVVLLVARPRIRYHAFNRSVFLARTVSRGGRQETSFLSRNFVERNDEEPIVG